MNYHPDNDMTEDEHAHWEAKAEEAGKGLGASTGSPKIIQILIAPNDALWQGRLIGLGDDGVTYQTGADEWEPMVKPLNFQQNDQGDSPTPS